MSEKPAMSEEEIETLVWELEPRLMEIRRDPRAALTAGLAKIRETMLAEYKAYHAKKEADLDAEFAARLAKMEARFDALMEEVPEELRACLVDGIRLRKAVADSLRKDEKAAI